MKYRFRLPILFPLRRICGNSRLSQEAKDLAFVLYIQHGIRGHVSAAAIEPALARELIQVGWLKGGK